MTKVTQSYGSSIKGVLGKKLGMTQVFDANNKMIPVTVVEAGPCVVTQIRTPEVDGYSALAKWPTCGLETFLGSIAPNAICTAE